MNEHQREICTQERECGRFTIDDTQLIKVFHRTFEKRKDEIDYSSIKIALELKSSLSYMYDAHSSLKMIVFRIIRSTGREPISHCEQIRLLYRPYSVTHWSSCS